MIYDQWKTNPGYPEPWCDDDDYDPREDCDHEESEIDVCTGRAECPCCGKSWYVSREEVNAELDRQARWHEWAERENRRQWWRDQFDRFAFWRRWRRNKPAPIIDDEIPF
jgi:hypothetical protein